MIGTVEQPIVDLPEDDFDIDNLPADPDDDEEEADGFSLDRFLYSPDYDSFSSNIVQAKEGCFALIDQSHNSDYYWQLLDDIEQEIEFNEEESWDEIMNTIFPMMHDILERRYNGIAFGRDDEVKIVEFIHRYSVYSFLESSRNDQERAERMENLLGSTQHIFLSGHRNFEKLNDNETFIDYQTGYESFLSVLAACKSPEEIKNATIALLEVSPNVDWEREKEDQTILGAMAQYRMEKDEYLYDDDYQSTNAYTETAQIALSALIRSGANLFDPEMEFLVNKVIDSTEKHYLPHVAELASIYPDASARALFRILQDQKSHEVQRHIALSLLYRIELGRIGISEEGVEYLTRRFDLGEYNNPDYSVQRITSDGKLGVFDENDKLKGFIQLEMDDFSNDQNVISKKLREITIDILFTPQVDETPEDREHKLRLVEEFKNNYLNTYQGLFPEGNGQVPFHFNSLSLPEQGFALKFLNSHQEGDPLRQKFFSFIEKYGEDGLKAFRSTEFDSNAGEAILEIDSQISQREVENLLREYGEMYRVAEEVAIWVKKVLLANTENPTSKDLLEVNILREQILRQAQDALLNPLADEDSTTRFLPGAERLFYMRNELGKIVKEEPTIDNFEVAQFILNRYFFDNVSSGERLSLPEQVISDGFVRLYNNQEGFSLPPYEGKTNDRLRSNIAVIQAAESMMPQEMTGDPQKLRICSLGAGDGGDAHIWAALGHEVTGIDISERMVADSKIRSQQFAGAYLRGEDDYSVRAVKEALAVTGKTTGEETIRQIPSNIDIRIGNFFDFNQDNYKDEFGERQPDIVTIMWHTLGFAGSLEGIRKVLQNAYDILRPGGRIFIEMPDRNFGGYARAIRDFHDLHPDLPFGTIKDAPSKGGDSPTEQDETKATWRYFPKNSEIEGVLGEVGFDISVAMLRKLESYFVKAEAGPEVKLLIKENMFVAEKPLDPMRQQNRLEYAQSHFANENDDQARIEEIRQDIAA